MIAEKELAEYGALCAALQELRRRFQDKKREVRKLLEETAGRRKDALELLAKANAITRHLTGRQRQIAGLSYHLCEIKAALKLAKSIQGGQSDPVLAAIEDKIEIQRPIPEGCRTSLELKRSSLAVILMIDQIKKSLLQLGVLEMRCLELIASLNKALTAFRHESRRIHRRIYPLGFISVFCRFLARLAGNTYFTLRDLDGIAGLGNITGLVLKIADSPLI
jgi:chromosome segregation ATPase